MKRILSNSSFQLINLCVVVAFLLFPKSTLVAQEAPLLDWAKNIHGILYNAGDGIATDASGNVYTTGNFYGTGDFDPGSGIFNMTASGSDDGLFISKLNSNGDFVWAKSLTNVYNTADAIAVDASGNIIIAGFFDKGDMMDFDPGPNTFNLTAVGYDMFVLKLNTNGDFIWVKHIKGATTAAHVFPESITLDASGNIYTTGYFQSTIDFDPGAGTNNLTAGEARDIFISKLDADGNFVWAKAMIGAGTCGVCDDFGRSITLDASGNVYTAGFIRGTADFDPGLDIFNLSPTSGGGLFVSKLDNDGNFVWAKTMGGSGGSPADLNDMSLDASGNIYTTGHTYGTSDFDPGTATFNLTSAGSSDIFISKLNNNGEFVWAKSFGTSSPFGDSGESLDVDASGNVYTTGYFSGGTIDFDPGAGTFNLTGSIQDYFLQKLDINGNFIWAYKVNTQGYGSSVEINSSTLYILGELSSTTADFDPGPCFFNPSTVSSGAVFIKKLSLGTPISAPTISSFTPTVGPIGTSVTITGTGFSPTTTANVVKFFNNQTATVTASTATSITTTVPTGTITGKISVTTNCITATSVADFTIGAPLLPTITSFTPPSGPIGTAVTITGTNFSATPANNAVMFNGTTATVTASTATTITTTVPAGATTGTITVTVAGNTATSGTNFTVTAGSTITINTQPVTATVCNGATATFTTAVTGTTNITYQWQFSTTLTGTYNDITNGGGYSNVTTASLSVNTTGNFGAGFYRCKINGDLAATVFSNAAELTVNSIPSIPIIGITNLSCTPVSATLNPTGSSAGEQYKFFDAATGGNLLNSGLSFTTPSLTVSTTYHISTYNTITLCESARVPALVNVQSCNAPVVETSTATAFIEGIVTINLEELISDADNNLDPSTLQIITQPLSGAPASLTDFILTVDYTGIPFPGTDNIEIGICDFTGICSQQELTIELDGEINVFNALSPNDDGQNEYLFLQYIELFTDTQNNRVTIYNRWGDVVFEVSDYDNAGKVFSGLNTNGKELPSGTYFYKIEFMSGRATKNGFLSLKR